MTIGIVILLEVVQIEENDRPAWLLTMKEDGIEGIAVRQAGNRICLVIQPHNRKIQQQIGNILGSRAGIELRLYCNEIIQKQGHPELPGHAKITPGFNLPAKYIIHTVGPIVEGPLTQRHVDLLKSCYRSILELAQEKEIRSLALCCISTGVFMFPNQKAGQIAVSTVREFLSETNIDMKIIFNVYKDIDYEIYQRLLHAE